MVAGEEDLVPERALQATYDRLTVNNIAPCTDTYIMQTKLGQLFGYYQNKMVFHIIVVHGVRNIIKIQLQLKSSGGKGLIE